MEAAHWWNICQDSAWEQQQVARMQWLWLSNAAVITHVQQHVRLVALLQCLWKQEANNVGCQQDSLLKLVPPDELQGREKAVLLQTRYRELKAWYTHRHKAIPKSSTYLGGHIAQQQ